MKQYFIVYKKFFETSLAEASSFRTSFALIMVMDLVFYFVTIASVSIIYDHVETIGPWNKDQLLFFISFMLTMDHLHMVILSENFWEMSVKVRTGTLDFDLLRPMASIFSVFFRYVRTSSLFNTPIVWGMFYYFGNKAGLVLSDWFFVPPLLILGLTLFALIEFCLSTAMFWVVEGYGINFLRMQFQQLARWPNFVYSYIPRKFLTVIIPVLLVGSGPVHFILNKDRYELLIGMVIAIFMMAFVLNILWRFGLRHYDSPSS